jgi:hypothetical protein
MRFDFYSYIRYNYLREQNLLNIQYAIQSML